MHKENIMLMGMTETLSRCFINQPGVYENHLHDVCATESWPDRAFLILGGGKINVTLLPFRKGDSKHNNRFYCKH